MAEFRGEARRPLNEGSFDAPARAYNSNQKQCLQLHILWLVSEPTPRERSNGQAPQ